MQSARQAPCPLFVLFLAVSFCISGKVLDLIRYDVAEQWAIHELEAAGGFATRHGLTKPPEWLTKSSEWLNAWLILPRDARIDPGEWRVFNPVVDVECIKLVDGTKLRSLDCLRHLRRAVFLDAGSTDYLVAELSAAKQLEILELGGSDVSDESMIRIARFRRLRELDVIFTQLTDAGVKQLANHPSLSIIDLAGTKITDASLPVFKTIPKLEELYLDYTPVTEQAYLALKAELPGVLVTWRPE